MQVPKALCLGVESEDCLYTKLRRSRKVYNYFDTSVVIAQTKIHIIIGEIYYQWVVKVARIVEAQLVHISLYTRLKEIVCFNNASKEGIVISYFTIMGQFPLVVIQVFEMLGILTRLSLEIIGAGKLG